MNWKIEVRKFFSIVLNKKSNDHKKMITLLGALMVYFCFGGLTIWGYINVYIASYFHSFDPDFNLKNGNVTLTLFLSPLCLTSIISIQLAEKIGFKNQIRACTLLFSFSVMVASYQTNYIIFVIFYGCICSIAAGLTVTPVIYIVWGYFPNIKGRISGYMFGMFGLSSMVLVPIISYIVNPNNFKAEKIDGKVFFSSEVYDKVPDMLFKLGLFYFCWTFIGASLIQEPEKQKFEISLEPETLELNHANIIPDEENDLLSSQKKFMCPSLKEGIFSIPFFIIFSSSFFLALYSFFLHINFKSYGLNKINDDHFVTIVGFLNGVGALTGRIFFGHALDKTTFNRLFLYLEIILAFLSATFSFISDYPYLYALWIFAIASIDGGIMCIIGPGLIRIFGFEIGSKLYPIKQTSFYLSMIIVPISQLMLMNFISVDMIFLVFSAGNMFSVILVYFLKEQYEWN